MADYIERESAIKSLLNDSPEQVGYSREDAADCIRYMDAADVAPVRHGRWVKMDTTGLLAVEPVWNCSSCGYPVGVSVVGSKYCPNCGAKMDLNDLED